MKKLVLAAVAAIATLTIVAGATAALDPGVHLGAGVDPNCVKSTMTKNKTLHLEKNCANAVDAAAGAVITGVAGQTFQSAEFTLASASQCQGGSPRFLIFTTTGFFPIGCNNVTPTVNQNGSVTYRFTPASYAALTGGAPTGTITFVSVLIDIQGVADLTKISFNGVAQKVVTDKGKGLAAPCKNDGWKSFTSPKFKNQGQCVKFVVHSRNAAKQAARG